jgi:riboflavin kinase / FMN adenylyltransferase
VIVLHGTDDWTTAHLPAPVLTIGTFDGVHRGHQALIHATRALASDLGAPTTVLTFEPSPRDVLRPDHGTPRIESLQQRLVHLEASGVDVVILQRFDAELAALEPGRFCRELLAEQLGVVGMVVGHDFRFGHRRAGDATLLREVLHVPVTEVGPLSDAGGPISSSRVRAALQLGNVGEAARLLGRPHELVGVVVEGDHRGSAIGFPTANLSPGGGLLPPNGVYAVTVSLDGVVRPGVANLGTRPTFAGSDVRLEVHLFGGTYMLYGRSLVVGLVERIREERPFPSVDALVEQIGRDVVEAKRILA